jgi:hypothetical protein
MTTVTIVLALLIGASLGLVGGGGSILTVPALVYAGGFAPRDAIVASLIVVGVAATAGAFYTGVVAFVLELMSPRYAPDHHRRPRDRPRRGDSRPGWRYRGQAAIRRPMWSSSSSP